MQTPPEQPSYTRKSYLKPLRVCDTPTFISWNDFKDIYNQSFPKYPFPFDKPSDKVIKRVVDGINRVDKMSLGETVEYMRDIQNAVNNIC